MIEVGNWVRVRATDKVYEVEQESLRNADYFYCVSDDPTEASVGTWFHVDELEELE